MKMLPYESFAFPCGARDVVMRDSYKPNTRDKLYYACPRSKKEERVRLLVGSPGASTTPIYSPGSSITPIYSPGSSTPPHYSLQELQQLKAILRELQEMQSAQTASTFLER
ncbi:hypothetical protein Tco_0850607 [Tanacetum coccineum]